MKSKAVVMNFPRNPSPLSLCNDQFLIEYFKDFSHKAVTFVSENFIQYWYIKVL